MKLLPESKSCPNGDSIASVAVPHRRIGRRIVVVKPEKYVFLCMVAIEIGYQNIREYIRGSQSTKQL